MPSERVQRQIDLLLDEAEAGIAASDWGRVRDRAGNVLALDPENADAKSYLEAADRATDGTSATLAPATPKAETPTPTQPTSFAAGRYEVKRFLGEGGKSQSVRSGRTAVGNSGPATRDSKMMEYSRSLASDLRNEELNVS